MTPDDEGVQVRPPSLPEGVLAVRIGPGANCSSAGSAIDILFYGSVIASALAVALAAALPLKARQERTEEQGESDEER
ncbi:MAG: hypothetical protein IPM54_39985 [Polyangiaceae bacterium]|nr:hypothetical protein [Polyangiaceae bacterium]